MSCGLKGGGGIASDCGFWDEVVTRAVVGLLCRFGDAVLGRFVRVDLRGMREMVVLMICNYRQCSFPDRHQPQAYLVSWLCFGYIAGAIMMIGHLLTKTSLAARSLLQMQSMSASHEIYDTNKIRTPEKIDFKSIITEELRRKRADVAL